MEIETSKAAALQKFQQANNVQVEQQIYDFNVSQYDAETDQRPWRASERYFKKVKISIVALIKIVHHAKSGGDKEVMGNMVGRIQGDTFIIADAFALPVEGTETRVNAGAEAQIYQVTYREYEEQVGRKEFICGWYHSHPGYRCWLSGIDVDTQKIMQRQDPMLAIVIDPKETMTSGKVEIGAFRTFSDDYIQQEEVRIRKEKQRNPMVPLEKAKEYGEHWYKYYQLDVSYFKSTLDEKLISVLWEKYWIITMTQSSIFKDKLYYNSKFCDLCNKVVNYIKDQKKDKISTVQDLIQQQQNAEKFQENLKFSVEKSSALMNEAMKNLLFSYEI